MKYLPLFLSGLKRQNLRQALSIALLALAFGLFSVALVVSHAFSASTTGIGNDQLLVTSKLSQARLLPIRIVEDVQKLPEVQSVSHASWFGGYYREPKNSVPLLAVDPKAHFAANRAFRADPRQLETWQGTKNGLMIGRKMADKFQIAVGQRFNLSSYLWRQSDGSADWDFVVSGIYDVEEGSASTSEAMFMHYEYLNGLRHRGKDLVNVLVVRLRDEATSESTARKIDALFANSASETKTSSVALIAQNYLARILNLNRLLFPLVFLVVATTFLIIATNVSNNVRQRLKEFAILRALGFGGGQLFAMMLFEIVLLVGGGAVLGVGVSYVLIAANSEWLSSYLPALRFEWNIWLNALFLVIVLSLLASIFPALQMRRIQLVEQLQQ